MDQQIKDILKDEQLSPLHKALFDFVEKKLKKSRAKMQGYYAVWDAAHNVYLHDRKPDKEDVEAVKQGLPRKITVPLTSSQILTGVAFGYMLLTQRPRFYEYDPTEDADRPVRECGEILVQRDNDDTLYKKRLFQFLLNIFIYGIAVEKDCWEERYVYMPVDQPQAAPSYVGPDGQPRPTGEATTTRVVQKLLQKQGNNIRTISPYSVYTDPGFHISDYARGSFVATDDEYNKGTLAQMESEGTVVGVDYIAAYNYSTIREYTRTDSRFSFNTREFDSNKVETIVVTEWIGKLNPAKIEADGKKLGEDSVEHNWLVWIANDNRIIRAEPMTYVHGQYPITIGMFLPDQHSILLNSLPMQIGDLQELTSWFMNSRMAAVSRTVDNQVVADPVGIELADVVNRSRVIRMTKQGSGKDVRRYLQQLEIRDTTTGHVNDMAGLVDLTKQTSGITDNMMGQFSGGRRSATEARSVNNGASARMTLVFDIVWSMAFGPQSNRLLLNHRQSISPEEFAIVCGEENMQYFEAFKAPLELLVRSYDYTAYDGTLPSDKIFLAQSLQEIFSLLISNPVASTMFNIDPNKVLKDIGTLKGIGQFGNYTFTPEDAQRMMALQAQQQAAQNGPTTNANGGGASTGAGPS